MKTNKKKSKSLRDTVAINRKRLLTNDSPFAVKESYVKLRTNLMFCMTSDKKRPCQTFAVTSSMPSEGKSLTAANIAISFAMLGKKTLLIDGDMRKPTQRRLWKIDITSGLCDFLADMGSLEMVKVENLPLSIICTGTIPPNPSELLASDKMRRFVKYCSAYYDYIIIDTPPINTVADAQIISSFVDGTVIIARTGRTSLDELSSVVDAVERSDGNICGVLLNGIEMKSGKYSYKYKYGGKYGYKYGYGYSYGENGKSK